MSIRSKIGAALGIEDIRIHELCMVAALLFLSFSIPMSYKTNVYAMVAFGTIWIVYQAISRELFRMAYDWKMVLLPLLFLMPATGLLWTYHVDANLYIVQKVISFVAFPVGIFTIRKLLTGEVIRLVNYVFILPVLYAGVYYVVRFYTLPDGYDKDDIHLLNSLTRYNRTYLAMHLAYAILFLVTEVYRLWHQKRSYLVLLVAGIVIAAMGIITIASRMSLFGLIIGVGFFLFYRRNEVAAKVRVAVLAGIVVVMAAAVVLVPTLRGRVMDIVEGGWKLEHGANAKESQSGLTLRIEKWRCAVEIIGNHPFTGVSAGDTKYYLNECYRKNGFWGYHQNFNAHNQYLHYGLMVGVPGILVYLFVLFFPFRLALRDQNVLLLLLILLIAIVSVSEALMTRQKAIMFFSLFYCLGMLPYFRTKKAQDKTQS